MTAEGVFDIVDYHFLPFGNAFYNTSACPYNEYSHDGIHCWLDSCQPADRPDDCFDGTVFCQHGTEECHWNLVEACALYMYPGEILATAEFAWCIENGSGEIASCAQMSGLDADLINMCVEGDKAKEANRLVAKQTVSLDPQHTGTPWVLVNGEVLDNTNMLLRTVCRAYEGDKKPEGCKRLSNIRFEKWRKQEPFCPM